MYFESLEPRKLLAASTGTNLLVEYLTQSALRVDFDHGLGSSLTADDLQVANLTASPESLVPSSNIQLTYPGTDNATAVFKFINGTLANGNYRGTISREDASNGGDSLTGDVIWDNAISEQNFYILAGDANRDRTVDITDLSRVATNWQTYGDWSQGDFNYDGFIDITDLSIVASNWQAILYELPQEPNVLTVSNPYASSNSVYLTWDAAVPPAGATAWRIQRSSDGQTFQTYAEVDIAYSGFFDDGDDGPALTGPGLPDGTRYWYRVRAIGADTEQAYTPKHGGTTTLPVPTIDTPTALSSRKIKISWTDNSQNATEFIVYRSPHGANDYEPIATVPGGAGDEYIDSDLSINTTYDYYVTAKNAVIESGPSSFVNGTTMTLTADMTATVLGLISGKSPSDTTMKLLQYANHTQGPYGTYEWNEDLWATGIDLSCIPVWDNWSLYGAQDHGFLITPRHLIQATHYGTLHPYPTDIGAMPPGTQIRFLDAQNNVYQAEVADNNPNDEGYQNPDYNNRANGIVIPYTDIRIIELTADVPSNIKPAKVFPSSVTGYLAGLSGGVPVAWTNQTGDFRIGNWNSYGSTVLVYPPSGTDYDSWYVHEPIVGDSSSAVLAIVDSTPVFLGTWWGTYAASNVFNNISAIESILGTNYSLSKYELS